MDLLIAATALAAGLPSILVLNKVDRQDARPDEVLDEVELDVDEDELTSPDVEDEVLE